MPPQVAFMTAIMTTKAKTPKTKSAMTPAAVTSSVATRHHHNMSSSPNSSNNSNDSKSASAQERGAHGGKLKHKRRYCRIEGCDRIVKSQGLCQRHGAKPRLCKVQGCEKQAQGNFDGMCKSHFKEHKRKTTPIGGPDPPSRSSVAPTPEGFSVYDNVLPASVDFFPTHSPVLAQMPLVKHLREGFEGGKPPAWHRNEERKARGLLPIHNPATQLEGWERELVWMEILVLTGVPEVSFRHLARAWGRDKGFHMVLAQFICERHGDVERKKRKRDGTEEVASADGLSEAAKKTRKSPRKRVSVPPLDMKELREAMLSPERKKQLESFLRRRSTDGTKGAEGDEDDEDLVGADVWDDTCYGDSNYNEALAADLFNLSAEDTAQLMKRLSSKTHGRNESGQQQQQPQDDDSSISTYTKPLAQQGKRPVLPPSTQHAQPDFRHPGAAVQQAPLSVVAVKENPPSDTESLGPPFSADNGQNGEQNPQHYQAQQHQQPSQEFQQPRLQEHNSASMHHPAQNSEYQQPQQAPEYQQPQQVQQSHEFQQPQVQQPHLQQHDSSSYQQSAPHQTQLQEHNSSGTQQSHDLQQPTIEQHSSGFQQPQVQPNNSAHVQQPYDQFHQQPQQLHTIEQGHDYQSQSLPQQPSLQYQNSDHMSSQGLQQPQYDQQGQPLPQSLHQQHPNQQSQDIQFVAHPQDQSFHRRHPSHHAQDMQEQLGQSQAHTIYQQNDHAVQHPGHPQNLQVDPNAPAHPQVLHQRQHSQGGVHLHVLGQPKHPIQSFQQQQYAHSNEHPQSLHHRQHSQQGHFLQQQQQANNSYNTYQQPTPSVQQTQNTQLSHTNEGASTGNYHQPNQANDTSMYQHQHKEHDSQRQVQHQDINGEPSLHHYDHENEHMQAVEDDHQVREDDDSHRHHDHVGVEDVIHDHSIEHHTAPSAQPPSQQQQHQEFGQQQYSQTHQQHGFEQEQYSQPNHQPQPSPAPAAHQQGHGMASASYAPEGGVAYAPAPTAAPVGAPYAPEDVAHSTYQSAEVAAPAPHHFEGEALFELPYTTAGTVPVSEQQQDIQNQHQQWVSTDAPPVVQHGAPQQQQWTTNTAADSGSQQGQWVSTVAPPTTQDALLQQQQHWPANTDTAAGSASQQGWSNTDPGQSGNTVNEYQQWASSGAQPQINHQSSLEQPQPQWTAGQNDSQQWASAVPTQEGNAVALYPPWTSTETPVVASHGDQQQQQLTHSSDQQVVPGQQQWATSETQVHHNGGQVQEHQQWATSETQAVHPIEGQVQQQHWASSETHAASHSTGQQQWAPSEAQPSNDVENHQYQWSSDVAYAPAPSVNPEHGNANQFQYAEEHTFVVLGKDHSQTDDNTEQDHQQ